MIKYVACAKIIVCILFYLNKIDRTEHNLIRPFCYDKHFTAAVHFRFEGYTSKVN